MSHPTIQATDRPAGSDSNRDAKHDLKHRLKRPLLRVTVVTAALTVLSVIIFVAGLATGSEGLHWADLLPANDLTQRNPSHHDLIWTLRAPRGAGAWLIGALLGLGGAVAQGLFRNPLAEPYLMGTASGATLGIVVAWLVGATGLAVGILGFAGAAVATAFTLFLARDSGRYGLNDGGAGDDTRVLLSGVIVGVLLGALADALTWLNPDLLTARQAFLLGSTGAIGWHAVGMALLVAVPTALAACWGADALDALTLGSDTAATLGLPMAAMRRVLTLALAVATATAVALGGLIGFIGLAAPHLARRLAPAPHRQLLKTSVLCGGVLLSAADVVARAISAPREWPLGVLTAIFGGVYLLALLHRERRE